MDKPLRIKIFSVLFFSIFTAMLGLGIIIPILPVYAETLGASGFWLGAIFAGFSISRSGFMPLIGRLSDRRGRKRFIASGLFVYALSSAGYIYAESALFLFFVRVVQGACSAMIVPIAMAYIGDICPKNREGTYMGYFTVSLLLGFGCGPLIGGFIQDFFSIDAAFLVMGCLCGLSFLFVLLYLPLSSSESISTKTELPSFRSMFASRQIKGIICYRFVSSFARASVFVFLPLFASRNIKLGGFEIGLIISSSILLTTFLQIPFGRLADYVDRRFMIVSGNILYSCSILLFPLTDSFMEVLMVNLLLGLFGAVSLPACTAVVVEEGKKYGMGSTMAIFNVAMSLGLGVGPLLSGIIYDILSLETIFYFSALLGISGTIVSAKFLTSSIASRVEDEPKIIEDI